MIWRRIQYRSHKKACLAACLLCITTTGLVQESREKEVIHLAAEVYRKFLSAHHWPDTAHSQNTQILTRVMTRLVKGARRYDSLMENDKRPIATEKWNWCVVDEPASDAWCLPGGKIAVYEPLLKFAQDDGSLAVIIAHCIAHSKLGHPVTRMDEFLKQYLDKQSLSEALSKKPKETLDFFRMACGNSAYVGVVRPFSEKQEIEADRVGGIMLALAGYQPGEAVVFWDRMAYLSNKGNSPLILSMHLLSEKRRRLLKPAIEEIAGLYYKYENKF